MAAPLEVIVTSDSGSQLWNSTVFDLHSGSSLLSYRGGNSAARTLTVLNGEYLLSAQLGKNFINMWEIQRKDQLQQKMVCQGLVNCVTASRNGLFLLAGVAETVYLWEVSTGKLLSVLSRHYQDITCLMFTDDSSHFVSGGKDNLAVVWSISSVIQLDLSHTPEPRHVLSRHSLPITDLHCGLMGAQARVATASLDQTVKVWELSSGELLLSVLFDVEIMSVTFDPCEYFLFCGGSDGNIFQVSLCSQSLSRDKTFQSDNDGNQVFKGHRNLVTCLSVSMDGTLLLSGSHDETARLWDVQSKQSIRCLAHKGSIGYGTPNQQAEDIRATPLNRQRWQTSRTPFAHLVNNAAGFPSRSHSCSFQVISGCEHFDLLTATRGLHAPPPPPPDDVTALPTAHWSGDERRHHGGSG
uniref:WD repeat domain 18 n=1 Tax=Gasterosteus aculeatus aculeatus TaxID=481459 RepID=G3PJ85_GASAC